MENVKPLSTTPTESKVDELARGLCSTLDAYLRAWTVNNGIEFTDAEFFKMCKKSEREAYQLARAYVALIDRKPLPAPVFDTGADT